MAREPADQLVNRYFEAPPATSKQPRLLCRPGLVRVVTVGVGPVRGLLRKAGSFSGAALVVSGGNLHRITPAGVSTYIGLIAGTARVSMDATINQAKIATGNDLYNYNGTSLTIDNFPDLAGVASVAFIRGFWLAVRANSQSLYVQVPGDTTWEPLSVASAEQAPDNLTAVITLGDEVWLFGGDTVEVWRLTGELDPPIRPEPSRTYEKGCMSPDSITKTDNSLFWVSEDNLQGRAVYRAAGNPERISDYSVEERLRDCTALEIRASTFVHNGHEFYALTAGAVTLVYDVSTTTWSEWSSPGLTRWRAHLGTSAPGGETWLGDDINGSIWRLDPAVGTDDGVAFKRTVTGKLKITGEEKVRCNRAMIDMSLQAAAGTAVVRLRSSDDDGATWVDHGTRLQATEGSKDARVWFNRLGLMRAPGRVFEISDDGAIPTRVSGLSAL